MNFFSFVDSSDHSSQPPQEDLSMRMRQELTTYMKTKVLDYDSDPLAWWKSHEEDFPFVARAARSVLSIPALSAPVERIFSTAGKIFRPDRRTRLKADKFESLIFIKCSKHLY